MNITVNKALSHFCEMDTSKEQPGQPTSCWLIKYHCWDENTPILVMPFVWKVMSRRSIYFPQLQSEESLPVNWTTSEVLWSGVEHWLLPSQEASIVSVYSKIVLLSLFSPFQLRQEGCMSGKWICKMLSCTHCCGPWITEPVVPHHGED